MEQNHAHQEKQDQSAGRPASEPIKSRGTRLQETIDRVRAAKAATAEASGDAEFLLHRVRNEHSEREMSDQPWCGAELVSEPNNATILNCDVTCPKCIEIIGRLEVERGVVDLTHFEGGGGRGLCGVSMSGAVEAQTLRETRCENCLAVAEELIISVIKEGPAKWPREGGETLIELTAVITVLREICGTLKELVDIQRSKITAYQGGQAARE